MHFLISVTFRRKRRITCGESSRVPMVAVPGMMMTIVMQMSKMIATEHQTHFMSSMSRWLASSWSRS